MSLAGDLTTLTVVPRNVSMLNESSPCSSAHKVVVRPINGQILHEVTVKHNKFKDSCFNSYNE